MCPPSYACPNSQSTSALYCSNGLYADDYGHAECKACPAGSYCTSNARYACSDGYFSLGYATDCQACPAGYYCPTKSSPPVLCPPGTTSTGYALRCAVNRQGYVSSHLAASQTTCSSGYYATYNATEPIGRCNPCPVGHYCPSTSDYPIPCASGYYADGEGWSSCAQCPTNYACPYPS